MLSKMPRRKCDYKLAIEHEYTEDETSSEPVLTTGLSKAESPSPEAPPVKTMRSRNNTRLQASSNKKQQSASDCGSDGLNLRSDQAGDQALKRKSTQQRESRSVRQPQESTRSNGVYSSKRRRGLLPQPMSCTSEDVSGEGGKLT